MALFKMFGKKAYEAKAAAKKMENRDMMEATIAGSILVAYADGDCSKEELETLTGIISNNPSLSHFGAEIGKTVDRFVGMMESGKTLGKVKVMKEIRDCQSSPDECMEIFATLIDIAQADGEIDDTELAILKEIGSELNVSLKDFGVE